MMELKGAMTVSGRDIEVNITSHHMEQVLQGTAPSLHAQQRLNGRLW